MKQEPAEGRHRRKTGAAPRQHKAHSEEIGERQAPPPGSTKRIRRRSAKDRLRPQATQTEFGGDRRKTGFRRCSDEGKNHTWFSSSPERAYRKGHALADRDALLHRHSASRADHVDMRGCTSTPRTARATRPPRPDADGGLRRQAGGEVIGGRIRRRFEPPAHLNIEAQNHRDITEDKPLCASP